MISIEAIAILWSLSATCLAWGWLEARRARQLRRRMERLLVATGATTATSPMVGPRSLARSVGAGLRKSWPWLSQRRTGPAITAGSDEALMDELLGWRAFVLLTGVLVGLTISAGTMLARLAYIVLFPLFGWIVFEFWLRGRVAARLRAIQQSLPTVMDLLALSLAAGMGLDRAIRLICERMESPLTEELRIVLAEIDLGATRREAFTHLAERLDLEDIRSLTTAIVQADELSTSMVDSMRIQAQAFRVERRQDAEAAAQRTPVMMLFPMIFFIMPALFIIILAPVAFQLMRLFPK